MYYMYYNVIHELQSAARTKRNWKRRERERERGGGRKRDRETQGEGMLRIAGESRAGYREMLYKWCNGADSQELQATCMWAGVWWGRNMEVINLPIHCIMCPYMAHRMPSQEGLDRNGGEGFSNESIKKSFPHLCVYNRFWI